MLLLSPKWKKKEEEEEEEEEYHLGYLSAAECLERMMTSLLFECSSIELEEREEEEA